MAKKKAAKRKTATRKTAKKAKSQAAGIEELVWVDPKTLSDNPDNWRKHPLRQRNAIHSSIKANGWADALKFNKVTGRLIDGHARKAIALKEGIESVPVLIGSWSEDQERHLLATLDPLAAMAETDASALSKLTERLQEDETHLQGLQAKEKEVAKKLVAEVDSYAFEVERGATKPSMLPTQRVQPEPEPLVERDDPGIKVVYDEEAVFKSESNEYGIPDLDPDMLYEDIPDSVWDRSEDFNVTNPNAIYCYSAQPFPKKREGGILGFYTNDHRFEIAWNRKAEFANRLLQEDWSGVMCPMYSVWWDWAYPVRLYNVYRARWLQRFWQEAQMRVIPAIAYDHTDESFEWGIRSIPENCVVISEECRGINRHGMDWKRFRESLEFTISAINPEHILIYGGGSQDNERNLRKLPGGTKYIRLNSYMGERRNQMKKTREDS